MVTTCNSYPYSELFHPDNIKNYSNDGGKVSISLYSYWKKIGGPVGLTRALKTDHKVNPFHIHHLYR